MADYDFEDKVEGDILASYYSYKGKKTTSCKKLDLLLDLQSKSFSVTSCKAIDAELSRAEKYTSMLSALANWLTINECEKAEEYTAEAKIFVDQVAIAAALSIQIRHKQTVGPIAPVNAGFAGPPVDSQKPVRELRPQTLQCEVTLGDLRDWKDQFTSYFISSNLRTMTYTAQQGYFLALMDKTLSRHLRREITATTPVLPDHGTISCFDILTQFFAQRNPIHLRRQAFFSASQKEGQSILDYRATLRALGNEGDLENFTVEGAYCLMYILGARDDLLRRELCRVTVPTLAEFDRIVEAHAQIEASDLHKKKTKCSGKSAWSAEEELKFRLKFKA